MPIHTFLQIKDLKKDYFTKSMWILAQGGDPRKVEDIDKTEEEMQKMKEEAEAKKKEAEAAAAEASAPELPAENGGGARRRRL